MSQKRIIQLCLEHQAFCCEAAKSDQGPQTSVFRSGARSKQSIVSKGPLDVSHDRVEGYVDTTGSVSWENLDNRAGRGSAQRASSVYESPAGASGRRRWKQSMFYRWSASVHSCERVIAATRRRAYHAVQHHSLSPSKNPFWRGNCIKKEMPVMRLRSAMSPARRWHSVHPHAPRRRGLP